MALLSCGMYVQCRSSWCFHSCFFSDLKNLTFREKGASYIKYVPVAAVVPQEMEIGA
jgi:hypothetical protein